MHEEGELDISIVRNKQEMTLKAPTVSTEDLETDRVITWCGAVIHKPHHAVRQQIKTVHSGVYITGRVQGSPAFQFSIAPTNFITHVNSIPTPNIDEFLEVVTKIPDNTYVRLRVVTFDSAPFACSIKTNYHYFPTGVLERDNDRNWNGYYFNDDGEKLRSSVGSLRYNIEGVNNA